MGKCKFCKSKLDQLTYTSLLTPGFYWCPNCGALKIEVHDYDQNDDIKIHWRQPNEQS